MNSNLQQEIKALQAAYEELQVQSEQEISGWLTFNRTHKIDSPAIEDTFEIKLLIPKDYPLNLPMVFEVSQKIEPEYEHINSDRSFCLAVPMEERRFFLKEPTLLGFVNNLVVPYLYSYCYWKKHGTYPFGEASHGKTGVEQFYENLFRSQVDSVMIRGLYKIFKNGYRGHEHCPCGSGKVIRKCHKEELFDLAQPAKRNALLKDLSHLVS